MMRSMRRALRLPMLLKRSLAQSLSHDCLNLAQSAAYAAMLALFPAMVVAGAMVALLPDVAPLKIEVSEFLDGVLPATVFPLFTGYFASSPGSTHTIRALILAAIVSVTGASSVIATLMEGLRRAAGLPRNCWTFWQRRIRALILVPLSLVPLMLATVLVMFGRWMTDWVAANVFSGARPLIFAAALTLRWVVSLAGVAGLTALVYHMGTPPKEPVAQSWLKVVPGAIMATLIWFITTLLFGWYVTRVANYSQVYGSLGAGIALLLWLYFVFLSVLVGAEFNTQVGQR